jgi:hypothetical protein
VGLDTIAQVEPKKTAYRYIHFKQACRPSIKGDHALAFALQVFEALISNVAGYEVFRMLETLLANTIDETQDFRFHFFRCDLSVSVWAFALHLCESNAHSTFPAAAAHTPQNLFVPVPGGAFSCSALTALKPA